MAKRAKRTKKMFLVFATTALGAAMVGGSSYALFTSSTSNTGNTFTAGTVVVTDASGGSIASQELDFANLAPGAHKTLQLTVKNDGSLEEWVQIDHQKSDASRTGTIFGGVTPLSLTYSADVVKLAPGDMHVFTVDYTFPLAANNDYQKATGTFNVVVDAVQVKNNTNDAKNGPKTWNAN